MQKIISSIYNRFKSLEERVSTEKPILIGGMKRSIQLDNYSCGGHAVNSIFQYFNISSSLNKIFNDLGLSIEDGVDTEPILKLLKDNGLVCEINDRAKLFHIKRAIRNDHPLLITVDDWEHWCLIYGYSQSYIYIIDSNYKSLRCKWHLDDFLYRWDDNWICVIKKK